MAIAITAPTPAVASTSNATTYAFAAFTPSANAILVILAFAGGTVAAGSITGGNKDYNWIKTTTKLYNTTDTAYMFWSRTPATPASMTFSFDCTGDAATGCVIIIFQITGADINTTNPIKQFITGGATSTNATGTFATGLNTNNGYIAGWGGELAAGASTPPASWIENGDVAYTTPAGNAAGAFRAGGEAGTTVITFTNASTAWGYIAAEIYADQAGPRPSLCSLGCG